MRGYGITLRIPGRRRGSAGLLGPEPRPCSRPRSEALQLRQPDERAVLGWLNALQELHSPSRLDRVILDRVHEEAPHGRRIRPVLLLALSVSCFVLGALGTLQLRPPPPRSGLVRTMTPRPPSRGPLLAPSARTTPPAELAVAALPPPLVAQAAPLRPALAQPARAVRAKVRPAGLLPALAKAAPASAVFAAARRQGGAPAGEVAPQRMAALAPAVVSSPVVLRPLPSESAPPGRMPTAIGAYEGLPPAAVQTLAVARTPVELSLAAIRPRERSRPMLAPEMLLQPVPGRVESRQRPFYKKPWFVSVMAVAATGVAAGVTAAVATSALSAHGPSTTSQPLKLSPGPS